MAFVPVPNTALVRVQGHLNGQEYVNTTYREKALGWTSTDLFNLATEMMTWATTRFLTLVHSQFQLDLIQCVDLSVDGGAQATVAAPAGSVGTRGGLCLPNNVAYTVSFRTGRTGRSFRGRNYIGGINDDAVVGTNTVKPTYRADVVSVFNDLIGSTLITQGTWVVVSRVHDKIPLSTGVTTVITTVITVDNVLDSQRRRLPGRGA
jgi:hypothetical protein